MFLCLQHRQGNFFRFVRTAWMKTTFRNVAHTHHFFPKDPKRSGQTPSKVFSLRQSITTAFFGLMEKTRMFDTDGPFDLAQFC